MNQNTSTTPNRCTHLCPVRPVTIDLPLATVEELDHLAELAHISRRQLLKQLINASLLNEPPHLPSGEDPVARLAAHAHLTHQRSLELAAGATQR